MRGLEQLCDIADCQKCAIFRRGRRFYRGYHATRLDNCSILQGKVFAPVLKYGVFIWQAGVKRRAALEQKAAPCVLGNLFGGDGVVENDL